MNRLESHKGLAAYCLLFLPLEPLLDAVGLADLWHCCDNVNRSLLWRDKCLIFLALCGLALPSTSYK